jgi:hypothetical protein
MEVNNQTEAPAALPSGQSPLFGASLGPKDSLDASVKTLKINRPRVYINLGTRVHVYKHRTNGFNMKKIKVFFNILMNLCYFA